MHVKLLAVGIKMPDWVAAGVKEYQKRLPREWRFEWVELPLGHRGGRGKDIAKAIQMESDSILSMLQSNDRVVALDVKGKSWSTEQLSVALSNWQMEGDNLVFLIGGPDGLSQDCLNRANQSWSLSAMTLPHPLVRVVLIEQLYRAWTVLNNHPYHK